jgi:hypothetical protein
MNKGQDKILVSHCKKLYATAKKSHPKKRLDNCEQYYLGRFGNNGGSVGAPDAVRDARQSYNIINPIVETKTSLTLDSQITTTVNAVIGSLADINQIVVIEKISDTMNDINDHIKRVNKFPVFGRNSVRNMLIYGICIGRASWDPDQMQGLGEVKIDLVDPRSFFPDPSGKTIEDCNYITIRVNYSAITLKKRYPDRIKDIDKLIQKKSDSQQDSDSSDQNKSGTVTYHNDEASTQVYVNNTDGMKSLSETITVYECYMKDDSTFIPDDSESRTSEDEEKEQIGFKYPYGRVVIYAGDDIVFEDKPIEIATGFPIVTSNLYPSEDIWGQGDVEKLIPIQKRINNAYAQVQKLVGGFISTILIDELLNITSEAQFVNQLITMVESGNLPARTPIVLTNNTLSHLDVMVKLILQLKDEAKEIGRVNDIMISGQTKDTVTSGRMVDSLQESPLTAIREIQAIYYEYLVNVSNYSLLIAQSFYNVPRIIRMASGKEFLSIMPKSETEEGSIQQLKVVDENIQIVNEIKADLSLVEFECEVNTGRNLPRSRGAVAQLSTDLWEKGIFGDPTSITAREILLEQLDFPNYNGILKKLEKANEELAQMPTPPPTIDKISLNFADMPLPAQIKVLEDSGLMDAQETDMMGQQFLMEQQNIAQQEPQAL